MCWKSQKLRSDSGLAVGEAVATDQQQRSCEYGSSLQSLMMPGALSSICHSLGKGTSCFLSLIVVSSHTESRTCAQYLSLRSNLLGWQAQIVALAAGFTCSWEFEAAQQLSALGREGFLLADVVMLWASWNRASVQHWNTMEALGSTR